MGKTYNHHTFIIRSWTEMRMMMDLIYEEPRKPYSAQSSEDTQYAHDVAEDRVHFEGSDPQLIIDKKRRSRHNVQGLVVQALETPSGSSTLCLGVGAPVMRLAAGA